MQSTMLKKDLDQYDPTNLRIVFADQVDRNLATIPNGTIWYRYNCLQCNNGIIIIEISTSHTTTTPPKLQSSSAVHTLSDFLNDLSAAKISNCGPCYVLVREIQHNKLYKIDGSTVIQNHMNSNRVPYLVFDLVDELRSIEEIEESQKILKRANVE